MAFSKNTLILLILCFILVQELEVCSGSRHLFDAEQIDCGEKCNYRCSKADRHKMCIRACNSCCNKCNCVPPGTSGNKDVCPCYASLTTHGGKPKCP